MLSRDRYVSHTRIMPLAIRRHTVGVHAVCTTPRGSNWNAPMDPMCVHEEVVIIAHIVLFGCRHGLFVWEAHGVLVVSFAPI